MDGGYRTVDSVIASYCKGKLTHLLLDPMTIADMVSYWVYVFMLRACVFKIVNLFIFLFDQTMHVLARKMFLFLTFQV